MTTSKEINDDTKVSKIMTDADDTAIQQDVSDDEDFDGN